MSEEFQRQLKALGIKGSMSRKGDCWDNAVTETLFGSLKVERLHGMRLPTRRSAKVEAMDWLTFYNENFNSLVHQYIMKIDTNCIDY